MVTRIITISRQFGSGGRTIGKKIAEESGYAYYDKDLIEKVAKESGLAPEYVEEQGEYAPSRYPFSYAFEGRSINGMSVSDYLLNIQRRVILELAEKEPCVIVGRCADYILKGRNDCLNVFIHADEEKRAERIVTLYGETESSPKKRLYEKDRKRAVNYKYYTGRNWGEACNYHLTLDSGKLGIDHCVKLICDCIK